MGLISVSHSSQLTDNSNSLEGEDKGQDDSEDSGDDESGEIEDSIENGSDVNMGNNGTRENGGKKDYQATPSDVNMGNNGTRENGGIKEDYQAMPSVTSVKKYQRAATRPPPGTVKSLMAKFQ